MPDPTLEAKDKQERAEKALVAANVAADTASNLYITFLLLGTYIGIIIAVRPEVGKPRARPRL